MTRVMPMVRFNRQTLLYTMAFILTAAFAIRLAAIDGLPLWTDEGWTAWFVESGNIFEALERVSNDRHPPLYFLVLAAWQNLAGDSHLALRMPAIFSGIISIALVYRLAKDHFNQEAALYAGILVAILEITIYYSLEVRHYSWLTMMTLVTSLLFLRYLQRPSRLTGIAYLLSVTGLMLTHYFGVFIMIVQAVSGVFGWRGSFRQKRTLIALWIIAFILYIPWMLVVFATLSDITTGVGNFPGSFNNSFDDLLAMLNLFFDQQIALVGSLYLIGIISLKKRTLPRLYLIAAGSGLFILMWLMNIQIGVLSARMISYLVPFLMILAGYGLSQIPARFQPIIVAVFLFTAFNSSQIIQPRLNFAGMTDQLQSTYTPDDLIILETGWTDFATEYEIEQALAAYDPHLFNTVELWIPEQILEEADTRLLNYETVWVVQWLHAPLILPRLEDNLYDYQKVATYSIANNQPVASPDPIRLERFQRPQLDNQPVRFGDNIGLYDVIHPETVIGDTALHVDFWWSTDAPLDRDYSLGMFLMNESGQVMTQVDAAIADTPSSQWQPQAFIHQMHSLTIPDSLPAGTYTIGAVIYYFETPDAPLLVDDQPFATIGTVTVE